MRLDPDEEARLSRIKPQVIRGDGYVIQDLWPYHVRYLARGHKITFLIDMRKKEGSWRIFGGYSAVLVELPLCWDNEDELMSNSAAEKVLTELREGLDKGGRKGYELAMVERRQNDETV